MYLDINNLHKLSKFNKIIICKQNKKKITNISNTAYLVINYNNHKSIKTNKKNFFYLSYKNYQKNWYLKNLTRLKTYNEFKIFYKKKINKSILIKFFQKIYKSKKIEFAYRKFLIQEYQKFYELKFLVYLLKKKNKNSDIHFDDEYKQLFFKFENKYSLKKMFNLNKIKKITITLFYPLIIVFISKLVFFHKKKYYKNFFRVYKNGRTVSDNSNLDWLVGDKSNAIFVIEDNLSLTSDHIKYLKLKNYNFTFSNYRYVGDISITTALWFIFIITPISILLGMAFFFSKSFLVDFYFSAWMNYLKWKVFLKNFKGDNYIVYHNYQYDHIFRNVLLNNDGFSTSHYKHTNSENVFNYNIKQGKHFINNDQLYLSYDYEFHQTVQSMEMSKVNQSLSKNHFLTGPSFIKDLDNKLPKNTYDFIFYNSSLNNPKPLNIHSAHEKFLDLILEVSKNAKYKILLKSKFDVKIYADYNSHLKEKILKIKNQKNIDIISQHLDLLKLTYGDSITICMPYCTPFLISLACKQKFFFVDFLDNFKNSFFSNYKNLVQKNLTDSMNYIQELRHKPSHNYKKNISKLYFDVFNSKEDNIILERKLFKFLN